MGGCSRPHDAAGLNVLLLDVQLRLECHLILAASSKFESTNMHSNSVRQHNRELPLTIVLSSNISLEDVLTMHSTQSMHFIAHSATNVNSPSNPCTLLSSSNSLHEVQFKVHPVHHAPLPKSQVLVHLKVHHSISKHDWTCTIQKGKVSGYKTTQRTLFSLLLHHYRPYIPLLFRANQQDGTWMIHPKLYSKSVFLVLFVFVSHWHIQLNIPNIAVLSNVISAASGLIG